MVEDASATIRAQVCVMGEDKDQSQPCPYIHLFLNCHIYLLPGL